MDDEGIMTPVVIAVLLAAPIWWAFGPLWGVLAAVAGAIFVITWMFVAGMVGLAKTAAAQKAALAGVFEEKNMAEVEALMMFEELARKWLNGSISEQQFREAVPDLKISTSRLTEMIDAGDSELTNEELGRITAAQIVAINGITRR